MKIMVLANILVALLFVFAGLTVWQQVEDWLTIGGETVPVVTGVSPLWIHLERAPPIPVNPRVHIDVPNYPFYIFWIAMGVNLYFIVSMQRRQKAQG